MSKIIAKFCLIVGLGVLGVAGYQLTEQWRRPTVDRIDFRFEQPANLLAGGKYEIPMAITNRNRSSIKICGDTTC